MAEFPKFPLWTDAYLADTTHLTTIEHGAYLLLLIAMWRTRDKSLPNDDKFLSRCARLTPAQWSRIKPTLMPFFRVSGGEITQSRLTDEADAVRQHSKSQSDKAKARHRKNKEKAPAAALPETCPQSHSLEISKDISSPLTPQGGEFERVWSAYPRKVGRGNAERAWTKARKKAAYEEIAGPLRAFVRGAKGADQKFIPHLATWLNQERWKDDQSHAVNQSGGGGDWEVPDAQPVRVEQPPRDLDTEAGSGTADLPTVQRVQEGAEPEDQMPFGDDELGGDRCSLPSLRLVGGCAL